VGGVEAVLGRHAGLLSQHGHRVRVITGRGRVRAAGVETVRLPLADAREPRIRAVRDELEAGVVPAAFEPIVARLADDLAAAASGLDVLVAHNVCSLPLNLALTAALHRLVVRGGLPPLVAWHHDHALSPARSLPGTWLPDVYPWSLLAMPWPGVRHVAISEARRMELAAVYGPDGPEVTVVPNGIDDESFVGLTGAGRALVRELAIPADAFVLLAPSRITRRKRLELAIEAVAVLRAQGEACHLVITGPPDPHEPQGEGYAAELAALARSLGAESAIHFVSAVSAPPSSAIVAQLYRMADAVVVPSTDEGFGLPILEAGVSRLPIVCTDLPVLREIAGPAATYVPPDAGPHELAEAIRRRLRDDPMAALRRRIRTAFRWETVYDRWLEPLLLEVAGSPGS
jgi:glycosyltransferase involved in cell wall biosynthesis